MKTFFRTIHLYLGLTAGLVIMITCLTGAVLVFEKELQISIYPERYKVEAKSDRVPIHQLTDEVVRQVPDATISGVKVYTDPDRSVEITYTQNPEAPSTQAFMNPYTGELISLYSYRSTFFYTAFSLHRWLLAGDTGKLIVGISTSIFLFILLTGIILWWPKSRKKLKQRLRFKWDAGWKRINHDLHIVIGFYAAIFLFVFAFTGLAWSFQWFNNGIYWITGTESKRPEPPLSVYVPGVPPLSMDRQDSIVKREISNDVAYYTLNAPKDSVSALSVIVLSKEPAHEKATDQYFFDQYTGTLIGTALYKDRNLGQRARSTFYPVHVGSIGGIAGRIIAFLACLAGVFFPVTGVILWINRLSKEKRKKKKKEKYPHSAKARTIS
jgi:uncharacterized iron-regulated membrane protein